MSSHQRVFDLQCLFAHSLRKFSMRDWGIEQKWMSVLLPLLLLYNGRYHFPLALSLFRLKAGRHSRGGLVPESSERGACGSP